MPIIDIINQPAENDLKAAYRPVVLTVRATSTDDTPKPPVVYCDVYVNDVFYKTQEKTQYTTLNDDDSDWKFDIQDICQEVIAKKIAQNAITALEHVPEICKKVFCRFRSSGINGDGFVEAEGTAPVQATGSNEAEEGDGTESNIFYIANVALQHENNQQLPTHLNVYKKKTWSADAWPLTHRPDKYKIGFDDSDTFPLIYLGENTLQCLRLNYRYVGMSGFNTKRACLPVPCDIVLGNFVIVPISGPPDSTYVVYRVTWEITSGTMDGYTREYSVDNGVTWLPLTIIGGYDNTHTDYQLTSTSADLVERPHKIRITPTAGENMNACNSYEGTYGTCEQLHVVGEPNFPDAVVGVPYEYEVELTGSTPITLSEVEKPDWMTIAIDGNTITFGGTPDSEFLGTNFFGFRIDNCDIEHPIYFGYSLEVVESLFSPVVIDDGPHIAHTTCYKNLHIDFDVDNSHYTFDIEVLELFSDEQAFNGILGDGSGAEGNLFVGYATTIPGAGPGESTWLKATVGHGHLAGKSGFKIKITEKYDGTPTGNVWDNFEMVDINSDFPC